MSARTTTTRSTRTLAAAVAAAVAGLALAGCAGSSETPASDEPFPTSYTAPPPTPVGSPTPEPVAVESALPAVIAGVDTTGWQQVAPVDAQSPTFRIPPDWTTQPIPAGLAVLRGDGQQQLQLTVVPTAQAQVGDGRCLDASGAAVAWSTSRLDLQPVTVTGATDVAFGAAAVELGGTWVMSVGLLPAEAAQTPRCPVVHGFGAGDAFVSFGSEPIVQGAGPGAAWVVDSLEAAQAYVGTPEYATIRAVLMSLELPAP
ncbi:MULTISPECIES: hypothetical protein [unclassified Agrococcus]|uniref:hypothetical protein n=1 Tax=unclassified Agrococcus TaxID=2615065 RepID=UPI00360DA865